MSFWAGGELATCWRPSWDLYGYYRDLGVPPSATRREVWQAYDRAGGNRGGRDPWLTWLTEVLEVLLDPGLRYRYDMLPYAPPGWYPLPDPRRVVAERRERVRRQSMVNSQAAGDPLRAAQIVLDEGLYPDTPVAEGSPKEGQEDSVSFLDKGFGEDHDSSAAEVPYLYSYYVWGVDRDDQAADQWMRLVLRAAREQGVNGEVSIGLMGARRGGGCYEVVTGSRSRIVLFASQASEREARLAVREWAARRGDTRRTQHTPEEPPV